MYVRAGTCSYLSVGVDNKYGGKFRPLRPPPSVRQYDSYPSAAGRVPRAISNEIIDDC